MDDPQVRLADSIFSDRINLYSRLREIESQLTDPADSDTIDEFVEKSIRLELCFSELRHFNDKGEFLGKHPFISQKTKRDHIKETLSSDPDKYFDERKNVELNITRYSSLLKKKGITPQQKEKYEGFLDRFRAELRLYKEIFNEYCADHR